MKYLLYLLLGSMLFISFSSFKNEKNGFDELPKIIRNTYSLIPAGVIKEGNDSILISQFYLLKFEVDNLSYIEFLSEIRKYGTKENIMTAEIDSSGWRNKESYNEPYVQYYHSHPAYNNYPVVNISQAAAQLYCKWLSDKFNKNYSKNFTYEIRLPSKSEWIYAASNDNRNFPYSWGGPNLSSLRGWSLCNYKSLGAENIHYNNENARYEILYNKETVLKDATDCTAPIKSYFPSELGLYNMNGNVAEMVSEKGIAVGGGWNSTGYDVRNESIMNYTSSSSEIGFRPLLIISKK